MAARLGQAGNRRETEAERKGDFGAGRRDAGRLHLERQLWAVRRSSALPRSARRDF